MSEGTNPFYQPPPAGALPSPTLELIRMARMLERMLTRRAKLRKQLATMDVQIKQCRSLLAQLSQHTPVEPVNGDGGELP